MPVTASGAVACGVVLAAYPLALDPARVGPRWGAVAILVSLVGALLWKSHLLIAATAALVVSHYALLLPARDPPGEAVFSLAGVMLLVLVELLDVVASNRGPVERAVLRRHASWIATTSLAGGILALTAQVLGGATEVSHPLLFVASAACGVGALWLIASLGRRALMVSSSPGGASDRQ